MRVAPSILVAFLMLASGPTPGAKSPRARPVGGSAVGAPGESACGASWETYVSPYDEFSVALPEMPALDHASRSVRDSRTKTEPARQFGAYGDGVVYVLRAYDKPRQDEDLDYFADYFAHTLSYSNLPAAYGSREDLNLGGVAGRRYRIEKDSIPGGISTSWLYVYRTAAHAYALRVVGADESHPCVQNFLKSFSLSKSPRGRQIVDDLPPAGMELIAVPPPTRPGAPAPPAAGPQPSQSPPLKPERGAIPAGGASSKPGAAVTGGSAQAAGPVDYDRVFKSSEVTRKVITVTRPEPLYTEEARKDQITGAVRVRMILSSDGTVNGVAAVSRLPDGLTENALRAARHIKFIPAEKDGRRVSQYVTIDYNFNLY
ncbi:MAG TPA: energy transducer TonB [Pyrinomonadaceae bacterium]|jgi:TonB family protein